MLLLHLLHPKEILGTHYQRTTALVFLLFSPGYGSRGKLSARFHLEDELFFTSSQGKSFTSLPAMFPRKGGEGKLPFRGKNLVCVLGTLVPEQRVLQIPGDDHKESLKRVP